MKQKETFLCIDLKSFYASVECVERGLDPFTTNLVVADPDRSVSTICLAITPAMKKLGIRNRCRIHEIPDHIEYIVAKPRMQLYMEYSARIYGIYLNYVAKEDIHVYSVDECFMDVTRYLSLYHLKDPVIASAYKPDNRTVDGHVHYMAVCNCISYPVWDYLYYSYIRVWIRAGNRHRDD